MGLQITIVTTSTDAQRSKGLLEALWLLFK
jgi:hypothetical protein